MIKAESKLCSTSCLSGNFRPCMNIAFHQKKNQNLLARHSKVLVNKASWSFKSHCIACMFFKMDSSPQPYQPVVPFYHIAVYKDCHTTCGITSNFKTGPTRTPRKSRHSTPYWTPTLLGTSLTLSHHSSPSTTSKSEEDSDSDNQSGKHTVSFDINNDDKSDDGPNDPDLASVHGVSAGGLSTPSNQSVPRQIAFKKPVKEPVKRVVSVVEQINDGLVPKPPDEVGRPSWGGYNLRDALGWDKDEYKLVMVHDFLILNYPYLFWSPLEICQPSCSGSPQHWTTSEMTISVCIAEGSRYSESCFQHFLPT